MSLLRWLAESVCHSGLSLYRPHIEALDNRIVLSFIVPPTYSFTLPGLTPSSGPWVVGDFNRDGKLDLATVSNLGNPASKGIVSVLLGNGDGTFQPPKSSFADPIGNMAVGDFNEDGIPDLAVTGGYNEFQILLGNGDGTFRLGQSYATVGPLPGAVAVGDFNGDGHLDVAVGDYLDHTITFSGVSIFLGHGDGTFETTTQNYPTAYYPTGARPLAVADFNRDGNQDLMTAGGIMLGNGDGTFQPVQGPSVAFGPLAVGDFNGDGNPDLAVGAPINRGGPGILRVWLGNGDGTFQIPQSYDSGDYTSVAVGDFNGDGIPDLALGDGGFHMVGVLRGNGDGTFQPAQYYAVGSYPASVVTGDFNGDGHLDLIAMDGDTLTIMLGPGDGTFLAPKSYAAGFQLPSMAMADFNGDGLPDLAVISNGSGAIGTALTILVGSRDGTFQATQSFALSGYLQDVQVTDFNGDGKLDVIVVNSSTHGSLSIFLGNGDGTFQSPQTYAFGVQPNAVAIGDFNGDGIPDLAVTSLGTYPLDPRVSILLGNGDGSFQTPTTYALSDQPNAVAVGDFNGDGILDVAVAIGPTYGFLNVSEGQLLILLGHGDGTFNVAAPFFAGYGPIFIMVRDVNGDGKQDLITTNDATAYSRFQSWSVESDVRVFLGNGDGTFQAAQVYTAGYVPDSVALADVNRDGIDDLVVANQYSYTVSVLLGNGDGTFQNAQNYPVGSEPSAVAVADLNHDGYPDVVVANRSGGKVTVLLNAADWGGGGHAISPGNPGQHPMVHQPPLIETISIVPAGTQLQTHSPLPLTFTSLQPNPVLQAPLRPESGQPARAQATLKPRLVLHAQHVRDALFERWGYIVTDVPANDRAG